MSEENNTNQDQTQAADATQTAGTEQKRSIEELMRSVEIRSDEVQEIMGYIPHWIIRWGITGIFIVVVLALIGSWFFKYPDIIPSTIILTTENPPISLVARTNGKIDELFVKDQEIVSKDQPIAVIQNSTNYRHLFKLNDELERHGTFFSRFESVSPTVEQIDQNYSLGELQGVYASFLKSLADYNHFTTLGYHRKKIDSLQQQIVSRKNMLEQLKRQTKIIEEELNLSRGQFKRSTELFDDGIISKNDFEMAKSAHLQKEFSYEGAQSNLSNSNLQLLQLEQNIQDMELQYQGEKKGVELALNQAYENLTGRITQWEQTYLLRAPVSGIVSFTTFWSRNQNVTSGDRVVTIVPEKGGEIVGKLVLPIQGSGKVKVGQAVNIKFTNFPYMDYGIVKGEIVSKSLVTSDNLYTLEVHLPDGLKSSYGIELIFQQEMQGSAEIITDDIRLLERIMKPIKAMLDKM